MTESKISNLVTTLNGLDFSTLRYELAELSAIKGWAIAQLGLDYEPGDRVEISSPGPSMRGEGWASYAETLAPGATGTVGEFRFSRGGWYASFTPDRAWAFSDYPAPDGTRYWKGKAEDCPEGMKPMNKAEQDIYPEGKTKMFMFQLDWLRKAS